jgi:hypothetical protein
MLFSPFSPTKPVFSRVKGKAQISIAHLSVLRYGSQHSRTQNPFFMGFGKVKAFWFWVILGLISKKDKIVKIDGTLKRR